MNLFDSLNTRIKGLYVPTAVRLRDGTVLGSSNPQLTLTINKDSVLFSILEGNLGKIAEHYVEGRIDIQGSMRDLMRVAEQFLPNDPRVSDKTWIEKVWSLLTRNVRSALHHTRSRDSEQIQHHYDVSEEFYELWLDPYKLYSCAYYDSLHTTLKDAQSNKLDHICNKLDIQKKDRVLDVGAGWGALMCRMHQRGAQHVQGITLSHHQYEHVNNLIDQFGWRSRVIGAVHMDLLDYRDVPETPARMFSKISSIGMSEHIGRANLPTYFNKMFRLLEPGGMLLNHCITSGGPDVERLSSGMGDFIGKYIFPGGELVHTTYLLKIMAEAGFEVVDMENLRPHYARTCWDWSDNLEANLDKARNYVSDKTLRAYRLYLAGCAMAFDNGWISLHQILAVKPNPIGGTQYPFTRQYMYR